jgi:hypothetical protein
MATFNRSVRSGALCSARFPFDARNESNLAEAEAFVQQAEKSIHSQQISPDDPNTVDVPLSAKLEAYGEMVALEKWFQEENRRGFSGDSVVIVMRKGIIRHLCRSVHRKLV